MDNKSPSKIEEENNSGMTGGSKSCPPCKRNILKATNIESLPDELISEILVRVPVQDLYDSTRLVCRKWYNMINTRNFAYSHVKRLTPGLLVVDRAHCKQALLTMQKGRIEISTRSYGLDYRVEHSCCNGLLLGYPQYTNKRYIVNPVTKQRFSLPPFGANPVTNLHIRPPRRLMVREIFSLAYDASSRSYKVVCTSYTHHDHGLVCAIMTVGVDTDWKRRVSTQHLSNKAKELFYGFSLTTRGFVHWVENGCVEYVVTMNVESEIITEIPGPCLLHDGKILWKNYLPMENYLSLFIGRREFSCDVWKMKPETGEWTKMYNIDLVPQKVPKLLLFKTHLLKHMRPSGWSNNGEVLFFCFCETFFAYNVRTLEIDSCELRLSGNLVYDHRNSLVWLD
ncbi:hypothetical protein CASFOL_041229 [Castilleja foliolosa]|uniref:F-box domain-containing protein n=1 Tax=Castilleja foliolosa TaxID=1961234 RepID=A0ABD3BDU8_9LAMI